MLDLAGTGPSLAPPAAAFRSRERTSENCAGGYVRRQRRDAAVMLDRASTLAVASIRAIVPTLTAMKGALPHPGCAEVSFPLFVRLRSRQRFAPPERYETGRPCGLPRMAIAAIGLLPESAAAGVMVRRV